MTRTTVLLGIFLLLDASVSRQDRRYWSESFGNESVLLNGSVVYQWQYVLIED